MTTLRCTSLSLAFLFSAFLSQAETFLKISESESITVAQQGSELIKEGAVYDLLTGILISSEKGEEFPTSTADLPATTPLFNKEGEKVAIVIGTERKNDGKILPFGYLRVQYTGDIHPSGTFLFNGQKELVAIIYTSNTVKGQGYATPIEAVLRGAEDYTKNKKISLARIGIITSESDTVPEVLSVRPAEPASKAGIKKGDFLLSVGEHEFSNYLEMREAFYYLIVGKEVKVSVLRAGEKLDLMVTPVSK